MDTVASIAAVQGWRLTARSVFLAAIHIASVLQDASNNVLPLEAMQLPYLSPRHRRGPVA